MRAHFSSILAQEHQMPAHIAMHTSTTAAPAPDGPAASVRLYRRVAEQAPLPIAMTTGQAHLLCVVNPAFCQLLGAEPVALLGRPLIDAVPASDAAGVLTLL